MRNDLDFAAFDRHPAFRLYRGFRRGARLPLRQLATKRDAVDLETIEPVNPSPLAA